MTSRSSGIGHVLAAVTVLAAWGAASAEDWPHWRGAGRNGVVAERSGWPAGWPPKKLWERNVGRGCASPIIVEGKLYVMGWRDGDTLYCFDAATGREMWKQSYPCPYQGRVRTGDTGAYGGPSSTPSYDKSTGWIYTISIDGDLRCWDTRQNGRLVWRVNLYDAYKAPQRPDVGGGRRDYGYPTSALIRGQTLLVEVGSPQGTVMAFDKKTGRRIWASQYNGPAGHTGGLMPVTVGAADCIAVLTLRDLVVMRVDKGHEGQTVATTKWQTEFACNIATPVAVGDRVLVTSAYNNKAACLYEVTPGRLREVWRSQYFSTAGSPVIHRGRVYVIKNAIHCLDLATGRLRWRGGSFGDGSCLATADDKIIALGNGRIRLLEASPDTTEYRELVRLDRLFRGTCYPHVTLSGGILCAKDRDGHLICFDTKRRATAAAVTKPPPPDVKMPKMADTWPGIAIHARVIGGEEAAVRYKLATGGAAVGS